jgi:hypothetical protein
MFIEVAVMWRVLRQLWDGRPAADEEGSVVEKVILTAVFAALAIAIGAIIVAKVTDKANSINLN